MDEYENASVRKIKNGYIVGKSTEDSSGYNYEEVFYETKPKIEVEVPKMVPKGNSLKRAIDKMKK